MPHANQNTVLGVSGRTYLYRNEPDAGTSLQNATMKSESNRNDLHCVISTSGKKRLATSDQVARSVPRQFTGLGKGHNQAQQLRTTFQSEYMNAKPNQISIYSKL